MSTERQRRERQTQLGRINDRLLNLKFRHPLTFSLLPLFAALVILCLALLLKSLVTK
jgi:hypothetical protein